MGVPREQGKDSKMCIRDRPFTKKNSGSPIATAALKQINCLLVRLNITLLLILVKSFGTVTYAISNLSLIHI